MMVDWLAIHKVCMRVARERGLPREDAEDVAQEAIARTWEAKPRSPMAYAAKCAGNLRPWSEASPHDPDRVCDEREESEQEDRAERVVGEVARPVQQVALPTLLQRRADGQDWVGTPPPEAPVLLRSAGKAFMRDSRVAALIAPGGTGNTFAFLDLGAGIATGTTWLGTYACTKGKVGVFLGEEDDDEAWRRLWHITQRMTELELYDLERNLVIMGLMGQQVALMQRGLDGNVTASPWFRSLYESLAAQGPWRALLFDPWSRWGGAEAETDAYCATIGISLLESLTFLPGRPAVIVAHHTRKMTPGASHDANDTRGSSAFVDGTRMVANLFRQPESDLLELRVTKANYTLPGSPLVLTRDEGGVLRPATPVEIQEAEDDREQRREEREERKREKRKKQRQTRQENTL